jgi:hypothetical protein
MQCGHSYIGPLYCFGTAERPVCSQCMNLEDARFTTRSYDAALDLLQIRNKYKIGAMIVITTIGLGVMEPCLDPSGTLPSH